MEKASGTPLEMQHHLLSHGAQGTSVAAGARKRDSRATSARTTPVVGVMSVPFSAVLAVLSLLCPVGQRAQVPLLLPQEATSILMYRAGPGRAELGAHCNQKRKQQDLEGLGCQ